MKKLLGKPIDEIVDNAAWQDLRQGLVGRWKDEAYYCVRELRGYLGDMTDPWRIARVYNYLTGTAFRLGHIRGADVDALKADVAHWYRLHREHLIEGKRTRASLRDLARTFTPTKPDLGRAASAGR